MRGFTVTKIKNGFLLEVFGANYGTYCFSTEAKLLKAAKLVLADLVENTTPNTDEVTL